MSLSFSFPLFETVQKTLSSERIPVVILTGPTASGKSKWALELAQKWKGQIINADSMQLYSALPLLTACPSLADQERVPHHLYQILDGEAQGSVGWWYDQVTARILQISAQGALPFVVGGTGLYLRALTQGLSMVPPIPPDLRRQARQAAIEKGDAFHSYVSQYDPEGAHRLAIRDHQRLIRLLEVWWTTGQPLAFWHGKPKVLPPFFYTKIALVPPREALKETIVRRVDWMMTQNIREELDTFMDQNIPSQSPLWGCVGLTPLLEAREGKISVEEAALKVKEATCAYAKRQYTWIRHQAKDYHWVRLP